LDGHHQETTMPDPKDPKLEREEDVQRQQQPSQPQPQQDTGTAQGGEIKDKEAETSDSYGNTRDSGERPR
jgi:hypothetical protein